MADRPGPVFSAYVSVNAAIPQNQERAYLVRMRDAMNDLGVPEELQRRVREHVEAETHPRAHTLVLFAAEDGFLEDYRLQIDVPESFRWGDPNVAPLTLVMDEYEPYGAAVLDAARGARLDFMLGENERTDILRNEFGGIAGLTRF